MGFLKRPKAPEPTAQELAGVARQSRMLDEETEELEKRLKAAARGKLGSKSLLAKASKKTASGTPRTGFSGFGGFGGFGGYGGGRGGSGSSPRQNSNAGRPSQSKK